MGIEATGRFLLFLKPSGLAFAAVVPSALVPGAETVEEHTITTLEFTPRGRTEHKTTDVSFSIPIKQEHKTEHVAVTMAYQCDIRRAM